MAGMIVFASAQTTPAACVTIPYGLVRGMENSHVLALQNFLFAQGLLKATPNGYFGPGTFAAVKALQKSLGFVQVGTVGPATRAHIKKATCQSGGLGQTSSNLGSNAATSTQQSSQASSSPSFTFPKPQIDSIDLVTLFAGGQTEWGFDLYGSHFSTTTNMVYLKNMGNGTVYSIGTFASATGTVLSLPPNIGNTAFPCGNGCLQTLSSGSYEISVSTQSGSSNGRYIEVKPFTLQSTTGSMTTAIPANASNVKLGTVTFSSPIPIIVKSVSFVPTTSSISQDGVGSPTYHDVIRGNVLTQDVLLPAFQTMIVDAYVSTSNTLPGTLSGVFMVTIEDYIGKRSTTFRSPEFLVTVQGMI